MKTFSVEFRGTTPSGTVLKKRYEVLAVDEAEAIDVIKTAEDRGDYDQLYYPTFLFGRRKLKPSPELRTVFDSITLPAYVDGEVEVDRG